MKRAFTKHSFRLQSFKSELHLIPYNQVKAILFFALILSSIMAIAQPVDLKTMQSLPKDLELKDELQKYDVTTVHFNTDIFCHFLNKIRVHGEYTRGLKDGMVQWNNVSVAMSMAEKGDFPKGEPVNYMENFTYLPGEDMIQADKFESFTEYADYTKNLVWDMLGIEGFAWHSFDKLQLNVPYSAADFNGKIDLAGNGFFENNDVVLTWTGVSFRNGENCAIIDYRTLRNPLEVSSDAMEMKGRSHYWGTIWVSLEDKQIEHAVLYEDVIMEILFPGQTQKQLLNATREITVKKVL